MVISARPRIPSLIGSIAALLLSSSAIAGMENAKFCLHRKPAFVSSKNTPVLCDDPATASVEPNYSPNFDNLTCDQYVVDSPLGASTVYVVIARAGTEGISATDFGVRYYGIDSDGSPGTGIQSSETTWTSCANGLAFPSDGGYGDFPANQGGLRILWNLESCQTQVIGNDGVYAVVGSFGIYAYSSAILYLTDNGNYQGNYPVIEVADCSGHTTNLCELLGCSAAGKALASMQFGASPDHLSHNPCAAAVPVHPSTWGKLKGLYRQ